MTTLADDVKYRLSLSSACEGVSFITRIKDIFYHVVSSFKTQTDIQKISRFKESEIFLLSRTRQASLKELFDRKVVPLDSIVVPIPDGMKLDYKSVIATLYNECEEIGELTRKNISVVIDILSSDSMPQASKLKALEFTDKPTFDKLMKSMFDGSINNNDIKAATVFKTPIDMKTSFTLALKFEDIYRRALLINEMIDRLGDAISDISENIKTLPPDLIKQLSETVYKMAQQLDIYGVVLHEIQRIEHCLSLSIEKIIDSEY